MIRDTTSDAADASAVEYLSLSQATRELPGRPHVSTLHRWRLSGVRGVKLRTCLVGGRRFTTRDWLAEFIDATSQAGGGGLSPQTTRKRQAAVKRAEAELDKAGI